MVSNPIHKPKDTQMLNRITTSDQNQKPSDHMCSAIGQLITPSILKTNATKKFRNIIVQRSKKYLPLHLGSSVERLFTFCLIYPIFLMHELSIISVSKLIKVSKGGKDKETYFIRTY